MGHLSEMMGTPRTPRHQPPPPHESEDHHGSHGGDDTYVNPLYGAVPPVSEEPPPAPEKSNDPEGTAVLATAGINALCTMRYNIPLSDEESRNLQRDFAAVFRKYDVPNIPLMEEGRLGLDLIGIAMKRAAIEKQQAAAQAPKGNNDGNSRGVRKEGVGQVVDPAKTGFPSGITSPPDILS